MKACHTFLDPGDTLVVPSLDRYGRSLQDLINMDQVAELRERGIGFTSLHENLDTTTPGGRLVFHVFAARARSASANSSSSAPTRAWPQPAPGAASADAPQSPPRKSFGPHATCLPDPGRSITSIAKLLGVSPGTLYNHIPDLRELRAGAGPRQFEAPAK
ncbi:recombinase family protein [Streptomyces sp. NPDC059095]|uniref:recombinase family protein n=1 Tax=Streptomyces sp. NPDC059095 TaxID=3346726 RepID=UPI0036C0297D